MIKTPVGQMRHRISLQRRRLTTPSGKADQVETWETYASRISAKVTPLTMGEGTLGQQVRGTAGDQINTRYRDDVHPDDRVIFHAREGDRTLNIESIVNLEERNIELELETGSLV